MNHVKLSLKVYDKMILNLEESHKEIKKLQREIELMSQSNKEMYEIVREYQRQEAAYENTKNN